MADVTIEALGYTSLYKQAQRGGIFWTSPTVGYIVYANSSIDLKYQKTDDGGATWGGAVNIRTGSIVSYDCWADWQTAGDAGTKIHIAYIDYASDDIRYVYLDTGDDSIGGDDQIEACQGSGSIKSSQGRLYHQLSLTKTRGGNLAVAFRYSDSVDTFFYEFYTSPDGDTWTNEASPWEADIDYILLFPGNEVDNQDVWAVFWDVSADEISLMTYDDNLNSWSEQLISGSMSESAVFLQMDGAIRLSDGRLILAAWSQYDNAASDLRVWDINGAGSITAKTNVITDEAETFLASVFINQDNDDIYVAYVSGTAAESLVKAFYQKSDDGAGTWGGEAAMQADAEDDERWISCGAVKAANGGKFLPVWQNDDLNDIFCNTDNGISIAAGGGGTDWAKSLADTITIADTISKAFGSFQTDSVALVDAVGKAPELNKADSMTITDSITTKAISIFKADTVTIADTVGKTISIVKADIVTITDSINTALTEATAWLLSLADTVTIADTLSKGIGLVKSETMTITDALQRITHWIALTLRIRSPGLTLPTRAVSLTLGSRSLSLTLQSRTLSLTLGSRSLSLTLPGR